MKKNIIFILIVICFTSCGRNDPERIGQYMLSTNELKLNPYTGHDTIIFQDSLQQKIVFIGVDRITDTNYFGDDTAHPSQWTKYYSEEKNLTYFTSNIMCDSSTPKKPYIIVGVSAKVDFKYPDRTPPIDKYIQITLPEYSRDYNCRSYFRLNIINEKLCVKDSIDKHFDKIIIENKSYYDVFQLHSSNVDVDRLDSNYIYPKSMFYSKKNGIISFKMSNGQNFIRKN